MFCGVGLTELQSSGPADGAVCVRQQGIGGLINVYRREAAYHLKT